MEIVSIIIPVYNIEKYIRECINSIINQTYKDLEIIIVDDGSTDNSGSICDEYASRDKRIKVIHQMNAGAANAKNTALDQATGEYVAFVDSDDFVSEDWIYTMYQSMKQYNADIVECEFDRVFTNQAVIVRNYEKNIEYSAKKYFEQYFENWESALFWNKLFRAKLLKDIRFRRERRCIDDEFFTYKALSLANKIVRINEVLYHYRQRKTSAVHQKEHALQITDDNLEVLIERYQWITNFNQQLRSIFLKHDVNALLYYKNSLMYNHELIKKQRRIARYYFKECFISFPSRDVWLCCFKALFIKKREVSYMQTKHIPSNQDYCFE